MLHLYSRIIRTSIFWDFRMASIPAKFITCRWQTRCIASILFTLIYLYLYHICTMSKLWQKNTDVNALVENFTVGRDREFDEQMAAFDVLGSLAHTRMLESVGLMNAEDLQLVQGELKKLYHEIEAGNFSIAEGVED